MSSNIIDKEAIREQDFELRKQENILKEKEMVEIRNQQISKLKDGFVKDFLVQYNRGINGVIFDKIVFTDINGHQKEYSKVMIDYDESTSSTLVLWDNKRDYRINGKNIVHIEVQ